MTGQTQEDLLASALEKQKIDRDKPVVEVEDGESKEEHDDKIDRDNAIDEDDDGESEEEQVNSDDDRDDDADVESEEEQDDSDDDTDDDEYGESEEEQDDSDDDKDDDEDASGKSKQSVEKSKKTPLVTPNLWQMLSHLSLSGETALDMELVMTQTGVSWARAVRALQAANGDVIEAILELNK